MELAQIRTKTSKKTVNVYGTCTNKNKNQQKTVNVYGTFT